MKADIPDEFPPREFMQSKLPYQLAVYAASLIVPMILIMVLSLIWTLSPVIYFIGWCGAAAGCFALLTKLLLKMDFDKPLVTIGPDAVIFQQVRTRMLPWASISKINFYETGRFRETKTLVFHIATGGKETFSVDQLAGISARQLFEMIRAYHRQFAPQGAWRPGYDSSAWTGLDDD